MLSLVPNVVSSSSGTINYMMNFVAWRQELFSHWRFATNQKSMYVAPPKLKKMCTHRREQRLPHMRTLGEGATFILDIHIMDKNAVSYKLKEPHKVLEATEHLKKKKCLQPCLDQHRHFIPFVISVDGLVGKEAKMVL
jgi:hypothetical protein